MPKQAYNCEEEFRQLVRYLEETEEDLTNNVEVAKMIGENPENCPNCKGPRVLIFDLNSDQTFYLSCMRCEAIRH